MTCLQNARAFLSAACITQGKRLNHGSLGYPGEAFACEVSPSAAYIKSVSRFKKHPGLMFTGHIQLLTTSYRSKRMVCHPCGLSSITWDECIPGNTSCQKQGKMLQPAKCCMKAQYRSFAAEHCHQYNDLQGLTRDIQLSRDSPAGSAGQHKSTNQPPCSSIAEGQVDSRARPDLRLQQLLQLGNVRCDDTSCCIAFTEPLLK